MKCGYTEERIGFGRGNKPEPHLQLYLCNHCNTVGNNQVEGEAKPRCGAYYDEDIT